MEPREAEAVAVSTTLIACIGWWDFIHRGGGINLLMGLIGTIAFIVFVVWILSGERCFVRGDKSKVDKLNK